MSEQLLPAGAFASELCLAPDGALWIAAEAPARDRIMVWRDADREDAVMAWSVDGQPDPSGQVLALYPRLALSSIGAPAIAYQHGIYPALATATTRAVIADLGPCFGSEPVALTWLDETVRGVCHTMPEPRRLLLACIIAPSAISSARLFRIVYDLATGHRDLTIEAVETSQGIARVLPDRTVELVDDYLHYRHPLAQQYRGRLVRPWQDGRYVVGANPSGPDRAILYAEANSPPGPFLGLQGRAGVPRVLQVADGIILAACGLQGLRVAHLSPPFAPDPTLPTMTPFPRPLWLGWYHQWTTRPDWGTSPDLPGNCAWVEDAGALALIPAPLPIIAARRSPSNARTALAVQRPRLIATWVSAPNLVVLESELAAAQQEIPDRPVLAYLDRADWPGFPRGLRPADLLSPQLYPEFGESAAAFETRCRSLLSKLSVAGHQMVLTCGAHDRAKGEQRIDVSVLMAAASMYLDLARAFPLVTGLLMFSA